MGPNTPEDRTRPAVSMSVRGAGVRATHVRAVGVYFVCLRVAWALLLAALSACSTAPPASGTNRCVEKVSLDCTPLYEPVTFDVLFTKVLRPSCATGRGTCHTSDAAQGGLVLEDADRAHRELTGDGGGRARVNPSDPKCSELLFRLETTDPALHMPPGANLLEGERCAVAKWIAGGAPR